MPFSLNGFISRVCMAFVFSYLSQSPQPPNVPVVPGSHILQILQSLSIITRSSLGCLLAHNTKLFSALPTVWASLLAQVWASVLTKNPL